MDNWEITGHDNNNWRSNYSCFCFWLPPKKCL